MANIKFTDTIEVTASHGRLAKAAQIYDDEQKATQAALNKKFAALKSGTDFLNIFEENAPDGSYMVDDLIENKVTSGRIIRTANTMIMATDYDGGTRYYSQGSFFIVIKDPVKGDELSDVIRPLIVNPASVAEITHELENSHTNMGEIISRISALEARLKV